MPGEIKHHCAVLNLAVQENAAGEISAFVLARWFNQSCEAILVQPPLDEAGHTGHRRTNDDRRTHTLTEHARTAGIDIEVKPLTFEDALSDLSFDNPQRIMVLVQPGHPLERQSPSFRKLSAAALNSPSAVVYAPHDLPGQTGDILVVSPDGSDAAIQFARALVARRQLGAIYPSRARALPDLQRELMQRPAAARFSLAVLTRNGLTESPGALMKLAALSGTPILVLEAE